MSDAYFKFADEVKKFSCGIYKQVPGALVPNPSDAGYKQIWDKLCSELPPPYSLPPPPTKPFSGGQCKCVEYRVTILLDEYYNNAPTPRSFSVVLYGEIKGIKMVQVQDFVDVQVFCRGHINSICLADFAWISVYASGGYDSLFVMRNAVIQRASRQDNLADTCGDPPKKYPPAPPPPPTGYTSPPTPISDNDGDVNNYIFNFYPPQKIDFPDVPFPPIVINVAGVDVDLDFDINFNFNGDIDFTRPGGGNDLPPGLAGGFQNLGDGIAGVSGGVGGLQNDFRGFAGTLGGVASNLGGVGASLADLAGKLDFKFAPPPFINAPEVEKEITEGVEGGKEDPDKEGLLGVLVTLTTPAKEVIFGNPNVYFAGWLTFFSQGGYEVREPIHFEKSYFPAPDGATGYGLTFTKGAKGTITVFSKPIPE